MIDHIVLLIHILTSSLLSFFIIKSIHYSIISDIQN